MTRRGIVRASLLRHLALLILCAAVATTVWLWTILPPLWQVGAVMVTLIGAAGWAVAADLEPQPRLPSTCRHCGARGIARLGPDDEASLLWDCPRCEVPWTSREGE